MGKVLRDEDLRLNIIINGDNGRKQIAELERTIKDTNIQLESLHATKKKMEANGEQESAEYKKVTEQIGKYNKEIAVTRDKLDALRRQQSVNTMTISELKSRASQLQAVLSKTDPKSRRWAELNAELRLTKTRQAELVAQSKVTGTAIDNMAQRVNKYMGVIATGVASFAFLITGINKARQAYSEYDEACVDAMKTTNLTREEVDALSENLKKIDTRTSQNALLDIARIGGKLGTKGKEDLLEFVNAADKVSVAFERDLGSNTEDAIREIGKLVDIFDLEKTHGLEQSILKTGSAINELGMASTANEGYIVNFTKRVAGIAPNANISIQNTLGLAATLDKYGQQAETSATAIGQTIIGMYRRTDAFAKVAGMSLTDFKKLLETDVNEALLRVLEGMGENGNGMFTIVAALDSVKLEGQRASTVLGSLAQHSDELRNQQDLSNKAFEEGTSVVNEFNIKNESATAIMEKRKKAITAEAVALGKELTPAINVSLSASTWLIKILGTLVTLGLKYKVVIIELALVYGALAIKTQLSTFWSKKHQIELMRESLALNGARSSTILLCAAKNLLVGNLKAASLAFKTFFASIGPIGWAVIAVVALTTAIATLKGKVIGLTAAQKAERDIAKKLAEDVDEEGNNTIAKTERIKWLMRAIENKNTAEYQRLRYVKELQSLLPNGIKLINDETIANGKAATSVENYNKTILARARARVAEEMLVEHLKNTEIERLERSKRNTERGARDKERIRKYGLALTSAYKVFLSITSPNALGIEKVSQKQFEADAKEIEDYLTKQLEKAIEVELKTTVVEDENGTDGGENTDLDSGGEKDWSLSNDEKFLKDKTKLQRQYRDGEIASETEYQDKLLQLEIDSLQARITLKKETGSDLAKIHQELSDKQLEQKKRTDDRQAEADKILADMETDKIKQENARYELQRKKFAGQANVLEAIEKLHARNIAKIQLDALNEKTNREEEQYRLSRKILQNKQRQELLSFNGSNAQRREIKKRHNEELVALDVDYMEKAAKALKQLLSTGELDGIKIDLSKLSEEELLDLKNKIEDLTASLTGATGEAENLGYSLFASQGDLFGVSVKDWETFFKNIKAGKIGVEEVAIAVQAISAVFGEVMNVYSAWSEKQSKTEEKLLRDYEKANDTKRKKLENRLNAGLMTEAQYNAEIEAMDIEKDAFQSEMQLKQAMRDKQMKLAQAMINTAVGVTMALATLGPIAGPIMAGVIGALGLAQIAIIESTPVVSGAEDGGYSDVRRKQDGRKFKARLSPDKRGFINAPTVLVGENGGEYVIPNDGLQNTSLMPLISTIETARKNGTLKNLNFSSVYPSVAVGRVAGGYTDTISSVKDTSNNALSVDTKSIEGFLEQILSALKEPIRAYITMLGKGGIVENIKKYESHKERGRLK